MSDQDKQELLSKAVTVKLCAEEVEDLDDLVAFLKFRGASLETETFKGLNRGSLMRAALLLGKDILWARWAHLPEEKDILRQRSSIAFEDDVIQEGVIGLCAAVEANEHGDARRALDLLRVSAELAERSKEENIGEGHVIKAKNKIELDCVIGAV